MATKVVANPEIDILKEEREGRLREVGNQAVWSLSSCKPGINILCDIKTYKDRDRLMKITRFSNKVLIITLLNLIDIGNCGGEV